MKQVVSTDRAPAAIGPYAQAVTLNGLIITSGQLPIDPATGAFPEGIQAQTRQSLTNVKAILEAAGSSMDKVVKTTVFLSDMNNFGAMNEVYATFFTEGSYPARSAVEVARLPRTLWWKSRSPPRCKQRFPYTIFCSGRLLSASCWSWVQPASDDRGIL